MDEEAEYKRQLKLFTECSIEKSVELVKIGELIAGLSRRRAFLDIGAGGGDLTIPISQSFENTSVVEPNRLQAEYFRRRCPGFHVYNDTWADIDLGSECFDFILCSHVLYYIPEGEWLSTIIKMYECLAPGGRLAIVLQSPIGEVADFFNRFTSYDVPVLELWQELSGLYGDDAIDIRYFVNEIYTETLEDLVSIGLFLLLDVKFRRYKQEISDYFENCHRTTGGYRLKQDEILLVVHKKVH